MKNSIWVGIPIGLLAPLVAYLLTNYTNLVQQFFPTKPIMFYVFAGAINLILLRIFYRKQTPQDNIAKGIMITTFLGMLLILYFHKIEM